MRAVIVVLIGVALQDTARMLGVADDQVIEAFAADRYDLDLLHRLRRRP